MLNTRIYCNFSTKNSCYRQAQNKHILPLHSSPHSFFKRKKNTLPKRISTLKKIKIFLLCPIAGIFALRREPRKKRRKVYMLSKAPHSFFNRRTSVNFCHPQNLRIFLPRQNPNIFLPHAPLEKIFALHSIWAFPCIAHSSEEGTPFLFHPCKKIFAELK